MTGLDNSAWESWAAFIKSEFGLTVGETALGQFKALFAELTEWNQKLNLISFKSGEELLYRHFADSLSCLKLLNNLGASAENLNVIDIGTGAGFPGLPCKIMMPGWKMTFVESITKKCDFISQAARKLSLDNAFVVNKRAEELAQLKEYRAVFDLLLSRAVTKLQPNIEISIPFIKTGSLAVIYKTEKTATPGELALAGNALSELKARLREGFTYSIPGQENKYTVLAFEKFAETPLKYPRKTGVPEKKPL
ncbi:MAG: 16S rRNA (guanine(527)-N(7))-methyltransferase RsmG [Elusimicrobia bacterium RIFOXYA1_FULL_47_7]|nr:MAG: 16S rRNA (guanine(527)-N(7))-methyltransferase RsmG [Elusimicrobia bacterium RIFOXYA12_FULL_49_49]OGS07180.1 MAG: 16S rRNA (guanine(527)-N(7))-methyltransferase RsmG [Elusimicrobia bacterium RIFOXYA1_FULL_47_7]OGS11751.1 MAG: 16S rRNA (guanine(527)-N(7))-methyltransferase RsmG [Elusimicrobia bacterium RIFOXYB1_FULL_48_9]OGS16423.1 MAG: 16S rRNA (guanine(527)-N(7))-methyltransferase RsmG [Elusimicrobia bacterium RIFOXYA2_FULL_47_53]OGS27202.1 MAG: 16S rRNA (guanine(527)-N(7))-methyltrans